MRGAGDCSDLPPMVTLVTGAISTCSLRIPQKRVSFNKSEFNLILREGLSGSYDGCLGWKEVIWNPKFRTSAVFCFCRGCG